MTYWYGKTKDGKKVDEHNSNWGDVSKNLCELGFVLSNGIKISLPKNAEEYIQAKTASADMDGSNVKIESRYIGLKLGNNIVKIRVNEMDLNISLEVFA